MVIRLRTLIVDLVHGGDVLARKHLADGDDVTCVDVYHVASSELKESLSDAGIRVLDSVPPESFDRTVMPTHCTRAFLEGAEPGEIISFSRDVRNYINDDRFRIEITGVKGKTSACYLTAMMLSDAGRKVLLHTSRGEGPMTSEGHRIDSKVSIAPPYILTLPTGDYDVVVCEVSLGGSGKADIACITNLVEDYGIAKKTLKASDAKKDIFTDKGINIVASDEKEFWSVFCDDLSTYGNRVHVASKPGLGRGLHVMVDYDGESEIELDGSYISTEYIGAMDLALEICHGMGVPRESVLATLGRFKGVPGRGEIIDDGKRIIVRERNPGISHISIARTLYCLKEMDALDNALIVLDPVSRKVCDKLDRDEIERVVGEYGIPMIITDGDGNHPAIPDDVKILIELVKEGYQ